MQPLKSHMQRFSGTNINAKYKFKTYVCTLLITVMGKHSSEPTPRLTKLTEGFSFILNILSFWHFIHNVCLA